MNRRSTLVTFEHVLAVGIHMGMERNKSIGLPGYLLEVTARNEPQPMLLGAGLMAGIPHFREILPNDTYTEARYDQALASLNGGPAVHLRLT